MIEDRYIKLFAASAGLLGLYLGGFVGLLLRWPLPQAVACALVFAGVVVFAVQLWLAPRANYIAIWKMLVFWLAGIGLASLLVSPFWANLTLLAAGLLGAWWQEPAKEPGSRKGPPPS